MDELARKRAARAEDNTLWSPTDALEHAAQQVKEATEKGNEVSLLIVMQERKPEDGTAKLREVTANMGREQQLALLEICKFNLMLEMTG